MHNRLGMAYAGLGKRISLSPKDKSHGPEFDRSRGTKWRTSTLNSVMPICDSMLTRLLRTSYGDATFLTPALLRLVRSGSITNDPRFQNWRRKGAARKKSIAVLPFENPATTKKTRFAGGIQDEILTNLAKVADLKVISRTSVMKYKSDLERIFARSQSLGVSHVVEGGVNAGERVRI
jgi:hypothetical protein